MAAQVLQLDARGLEPPQPMVRILEALEVLPASAELHARTDRNPVHLHPFLAERGFLGNSTAAPNHEQGFVTIIRRADPSHPGDTGGKSRSG